MSRSLTIACQAILFVASAFALGGCFVRSNPQPMYYQGGYARPAPVVYQQQVYTRPAYAQPVYAQPGATVYVR